MIVSKYDRETAVGQCLRFLYNHPSCNDRSHAERLIVPTLCVGMQQGTLCVPEADAERPGRHSPAERGNDQSNGVR
ncbi:hypothetical protein QF019_003769 [Pseudomonas frederiksbergensis]